MSLHNNPKYQIPALVDALKQHGLKHNSPSQLADAFRTGWVAALATPAQQAAPMSPANRLVAYSAATRLRELGFEWDATAEAWLQPAPSAQAADSVLEGKP